MQGPHWAGLGPAPLSPGHFQEAACFWAQRQVCWFTGSRLAPEVKEAQDGAFRDARPPSSSSMSSGDCSPLSHHQSHPVPVPLLFQPHQPWASGHSLLIHPAGLIPRRLQPISQGRSQPPPQQKPAPPPPQPPAWEHPAGWGGVGSDSDAPFFSTCGPWGGGFSHQPFPGGPRDQKGLPHLPHRLHHSRGTLRLTLPHQVGDAGWT